MANVFKKGIDRMMWTYTGVAPNAHAAGAGICTDLRNDLSRNPFAYQLVSNTVQNRYNFITKAWAPGPSPALAGTFGAGAGCVFAPSFALVGVLGSGSTTTVVNLSTALPNPVAPNMLANRGGSGEYGYRIRIIGYATGKTEERRIIGNSAGATPSILVDTAFSFTPSANDRYEILSGRIFYLGAGTLASGSWKSFELASNTLATKTQTNLPATLSTDFSALALDELYVPYDRKPGEGFVVGTGTYDASGTAKFCLTATNISSGTIVGQSTGAELLLKSNEYRNFQIRIVEDTVNVTAVGQRRIIASHTAGGAGAITYSLGSNWSVTPSTNCKFVIENPNLIVLQSSAGLYMYTYNYMDATINNGTNSIAADAWSTAYFAAPGNAHGAGVVLLPSWGMEPDSERNARHSCIYRFRGGGVTTLDVFDMAASITGTWSNAVTYDGASPNFNTGTCGKYAPFDNDGKFGYINAYVASQLNQMWRFDVKNRVLTPFTPTDFIQSGTAAVGDRLASIVFVDGSDKYSGLLLVPHLTSVAQELIVLA